MNSKIIFNRKGGLSASHDFAVNDSVKGFFYELLITDYEV
jgi:hypothetical protein